MNSEPEVTSPFGNEPEPAQSSGLTSVSPAPPGPSGQTGTGFDQMGYGVAFVVVYFVLFVIAGGLLTMGMDYSNPRYEKSFVADGSTQNFTVNTEVTPSNCDVWVEIDDNSPFGFEARSDCSDTLTTYGGLILVGFANGSQANWSVHLGLPITCPTTVLITPVTNYYDRGCNGIFEGVLGGYDLQSGWLNITLPQPIEDGQPLALKYWTADGNTQTEVGSISENEIVVNWPYPPPTDSRVTVSYYDQGAVSTPEGDRIASQVGLVFNPLLIYGIAAVVALVKGKRRFAKGIGLTIAVGFILVSFLAVAFMF